MFFKKGDVLAELDARDQALRADMAKFRYLQALNQQKIAERDYNISKQLHEQKIDSKVAFENAEIAYNNAVLNASIAETDMKTANKALSDTKLRAPYDCVVSRQLKSLGESSMGGPENGAAYEVFDSSPPELVLNAPESLLGEVKVGQDIEIIVTALQLKLPATVVRFVPIIATDNRNFVIVAHLKTADKRVVPGYFVEGVLKARRKSGKSL
jgi:multidrug resistance efflux pump